MSLIVKLSDVPKWSSSQGSSSDDLPSICASRSALFHVCLLNAHACKEVVGHAARGMLSQQYSIVVVIATSTAHSFASKNHGGKGRCTFWDQGYLVGGLLNGRALHCPCPCIPIRVYHKFVM